MDRPWFTMTLCAMLGAASAVAVRPICVLLLKQRGIPAVMPQRHFWILLGCITAAGAIVGWRAGISARGVYLLLLLCAAACTFYIDAIYRVIPNELVLAVLGLAAVFGLTGAVKFDIVSSLLGFALCFALFFVPAVLGRKIGAGDVKFAAAVGFALGFNGSLYAIAAMGALVLLYILFLQRVPLAEKWKTMIPMGPFLSLALVVVSVL